MFGNSVEWGIEFDHTSVVTDFPQTGKEGEQLLNLRPSEISPGILPQTSKKQ